MDHNKDDFIYLPPVYILKLIKSNKTSYTAREYLDDLSKYFASYTTAKKTVTTITEKTPKTTKDESGSLPVKRANDKDYGKSHPPSSIKPHTLMVGSNSAYQQLIEKKLQELRLKSKNNDQSPTEEKGSKAKTFKKEKELPESSKEENSNKGTKKDLSTIKEVSEPISKAEEVKQTSPVKDDKASKKLPLTKEKSVKGADLQNVNSNKPKNYNRVNTKQKFSKEDSELEESQSEIFSMINDTKGKLSSKLEVPIAENKGSTTLDKIKKNLQDSKNKQELDKKSYVTSINDDLAEYLLEYVKKLKPEKEPGNIEMTGKNYIVNPERLNLRYKLVIMMVNGKPKVDVYRQDLGTLVNDLELPDGAEIVTKIYSEVDNILSSKIKIKKL